LLFLTAISVLYTPVYVCALNNLCYPGRSRSIALDVYKFY